jgi:hypothetical protein
MRIKTKKTKTMKQGIISKSFSTTTPDAYEAGLELGEALTDIHPEIIFLFISVHYDFDEIFEALYEGLGTTDVILFGGTGDGFYETENVGNNGITALGVNSMGTIDWSLSYRKVANDDPEEAARECAQEVLRKAGGEIDVAIVFADLFCDGVSIVKGVSDVISVPFVGGLTGDDWQFKKGFLFTNGEVHNDAVAILGMSGDFSFAANSASGWKPMGKKGIVDETDGNILSYIDGKTAFDFIEEQFGISPAEAALGVVSLAAYESEDPNHFYLRSAKKLDVDSGDVALFGSIKEGTPVRVCNATEDDVVAGVVDAISGLGDMGFDPNCGLLISCGARKWLLGDRVNEEVSQVLQALDKKIPVIGFPSFGEIGPIMKPNGSYTDTYFHNVSFVVLLFGSGSDHEA